MEDILDLYEEPYDPKRPKLCVDERPFQLLEDVIQPIPMDRGRTKKQDYHYKRKGVCSIFIAFDLRGWRYVEVREHRTKEDYAEFMSNVADYYPDAEVIRVVQDNLNTHTYGSFYQRFEPEKARKLCKKFEFHYTPKKASWLNMAEIEFSALAKQCLDRRIGDTKILEPEVQAWAEDRNRKGVKVKWRFTTENARKKLSRHYSIVKN